mmetsp:Transcript_26892/g.48595  ORF Transcript_26892/g.48595 Transcript_26892/m.48595 type:complete len:722 (-) Transcript_26892:80-2245(-)
MSRPSTSCRFQAAVLLVVLHGCRAYRDDTGLLQDQQTLSEEAEDLHTATRHDHRQEEDPVEDAAKKSLFERLSQKGGRPVWQVEVGILTVAVVLAVAVGVRLGRSARPQEEVKASASSAAEGEETEGATPQEKMKMLRKKKTRCLVQQAVDRNKLEEVLRQILELEAATKEQEQPTPEEIKKKAEDAIMATDIAVDKTLVGGLAYLVPMMYQSGRIYEALEKRRLQAQENTAKLMLEETKALTEDMQEIFEVKDIKTSIFKTIKKIDAPSLATIVASVIAPTQIKLMSVFNLLDLVSALVVLLIDATTIALDRDLSCHSFIMNEHDFEHLVDRWTQLDGGIALFCVLVRYWVYRACQSVVKDLETPPDLSEVQDDPVKVMRLLLGYYLSSGTKAIQRYDSITSSTLFALSKLTALLSMLLLGFATHVILNTPWHTCKEPGLIIVRIRVISFLILFVPHLLSIVMFFVGRYLTGQGMQLKLLQAAERADQNIASGLPLFTILVQALVIRNKRDMISVQLQLIQTKKEIAEQQRVDAEKSLERLRQEEETTKQTYEQTETTLKAEVAMSDEEILRQQEQKKEELVDDAEEVFVLLNARAKKMSKDAEEQMKKFGEGEGGELLRAMSRGEGAEKLQKVLAEAGQSVEEQATAAAKFAEDKLKSEEVQQALQAGKAAASDAATAAQEKLNSEEVQQAVQAGKAAASNAATAAQAATSDASKASTK